MNPPSANQLRVLSPLQFELSAEQDKIYDHILSLREFAARRFDKVTKVFRLFGDACKPKSHDDQLVEVKAMGLGLLLKYKRIATVRPTCIIGFAFCMPNGKPGYVALATYPHAVELRDNLIIETNSGGKAVWCGLVETFAKPCTKCKGGCNICSESHILACEVLDECERQGILHDVHDATGYWHNRDTQALDTIGCLVNQGKIDISSQLRR